MRNDALDPKICYFCGGPSSRKLILNPATKVLNSVYLTCVYAGRRYPVCEACSKPWDARLNKINADAKAKTDELFELMIAKKGAINEQPETTEPLHSDPQQ